MTDNVIWHTDFRARREREAAELEMASEALIGPLIQIFTKATDTSPSEMNPQDSG